MIRPALAALLLTASAARAATVTITVENVRNNQGHVLVALCSKADFLHPNCHFHGKAPAQTGTVAIAISNVPPGEYAAQAFHDENDNLKLDRNFLGLPKEAMGFSNDAPMRMGPPKFGAASFQVGRKDSGVSFRLRYF